MIKDIHLIDAIDLIKPHIIYDITHLDKYKGIYMNFNSISREYKVLSRVTGKKFLIRRIESGDIEFRNTQKNIIEYSIYSIRKYLYDLEIFKEHFIDVKTAIIKMGYSKKEFKANPQDRFKLLDERNLITLISLSAPINHRQTFFISKFELDAFLDSHISHSNAASLLNVSLVTLRQYWLPKYCEDQINLIITEPNLCFVNKTTWLHFAKEKNKSNVLSINQCAKKLNVSNTTFNLITEQYNLVGEKFEFNIESGTYYLEDDINCILEEQNTLFDYYSNNYYTTKETLKIFGLTQNNLHRDTYTSQIEIIQVPPLIYINKDRFEFRKSSNKNLYKKDDVNLFKDKKDFEKQYEFILLQIQDSPFNIFLTLCNYLDIEFNENTNETKKLWFNYINQKFNNSHAVDKTLRMYIRNFITSTKILIDTIGEKEIYECSTPHLQLKIYTEKYPKEARNELSKFLSKVYDHCTTNGKKINYNNNFPNYYSNTRNSEKDIYSLDVYKQFFQYLNSKEIHLNKAINAALSQINRNYEDLYDSTWLYCLLHLNNAWRHYDVTTFPKIDLTGLSISKMAPLEALKTIKQNGLSNLEINLIIYRCKSLNLIHSKTRKKRHFFCSQELANALAHAIVVCTLRNATVTPLSNMIIETDTSNRTIKDKFINDVFKEDVSLPAFKSKCFNRTVISLIYSIIKKQTKGNPMDLVKIVRSHVDIETTNIYTDIPQEDIDFITKQLFDLGNYGHVYDTLSKLLSNPVNKENVENEVISPQVFKHLFGDIYHVEQSIHVIKEIARERESVLDLLKMNSKDENNILKLNLTLGQLPAKQENFQCIFNKCKLPDYDCAMCPYAVFNFYNINELCEEFIEFLKEYLKTFNKEQYIAEKKRLANRLYFYLTLIQEFKNTFGEEVLNLFLPFQFSDLKQILREIPSSKKYTTITFRNED
ncbi:hypothetical protein [Viridibacillus arvi]|uniref:hypothetical protein n=1 Tax=Viridibacillus arvi TaxID=263475 RepID=UPI003CFC5FE7